MIEIRWHGRGGQGAFTASKILGGGAIQAGKYAMAFPSFGPERRGAPIQAFTKIAAEPIKNRSAIKSCDYMIFLDETLFEFALLKDLKEGGKVILNTAESARYKKFEQIVTIDGNRLAQEIIHMPVVNTVMLGAFAGICPEISVKDLSSAMEAFLPARIAQKNKLALENASKEVRKSGN